MGTGAARTEPQSESPSRNVRFADEQEATGNAEDEQMVDTQAAGTADVAPGAVGAVGAVEDFQSEARKSTAATNNQEDAEIQNEEIGGENAAAEEEQNFQQYQSKCILIFKVENNANEARNVEFTIKPKLDADGVPSKLNFKCPVSVVPCSVFSSSNTDIIHLTKLDPDLDWWGEFEWTSRVLEKPNNNSMGSYPPVNNSGNAYGGVGTGSTGDYYTGAGQADEGYGISSVDANVGAADEKQCPVCTYLNPAILRVCEICQSTL